MVEHAVSRRHFVLSASAAAALAAGADRLVPGVPTAHAASNSPGRVAALAAEIRAGKRRATDVAAGLRGGLGKLSPLNVATAVDHAGARRRGQALDGRVLRGNDPGPLAGVPLAVKANIAIAGMTTSAGTPGLTGYRAEADAPIVARLRQAGAVPAVHNNMHELALGVTSQNALFGAVANPYDAARSPGGSSGGTAAAVAAGLTPAGLGTDTGGSVRIPAAFCGVAALRPTHGRYPLGGVVPISHQRDTPGFIGAGVADVGYLDSIAVGDKAGVPAPAELAELRLGVPRAHFYASLSDGVAAALENTLKRLRDGGATLVETDLPEVAELTRQAAFPLTLYDLVRDLPQFLAEHPTGTSFAELAAQVASPDVYGVLKDARDARRVSHDQYRAALGARDQLAQRYRAYFRDNNLAALIVPTVPRAAPPIDVGSTVALRGEQVPTFPTLIRNTDPVATIGLPSATVPVGTTDAGLPVGANLDGPAGSDRQLLAIARAIEAQRGELPQPSWHLDA